MIRLINGVTGTEMWVTESRLSVALARGHRLPDSEKPKAEPKPAPKKTTAKRK